MANRDNINLSPSRDTIAAPSRGECERTAMLNPLIVPLPLPVTLDATLSLRGLRSLGVAALLFARGRLLRRGGRARFGCVAYGLMRFVLCFFCGCPNGEARSSSSISASAARRSSPIQPQAAQCRYICDRMEPRGLLKPWRCANFGI